MWFIHFIFLVPPSSGENFELQTEWAGVQETVTEGLAGDQRGSKHLYVPRMADRPQQPARRCRTPSGLEAEPAKGSSLPKVTPRPTQAQIQGQVRAFSPRIPSKWLDFIHGWDHRSKVHIHEEIRGVLSSLFLLFLFFFSFKYLYIQICEQSTCIIIR